MGLKRRRFLGLGGGILGGVGLSMIGHRLLADSAPVPTRGPAPSPLPEPVPSPVASPAPAGLFAPPRGDVRIVVISDLNSQYGSTDYDPEVDQAIAFTPDWQPDLVLCGGDMVAGQSASLSRAQIEAMWAAFDQHVAAPLRRAQIPFGFTVGNHDASAAQSGGQYSFQQERDLAAAYWNASQHNPGLTFVDRAQFPFYYTFAQKNIFYLVWDASASRLSAEQLAWVERSLASEAAQSATLRIAIGHLPLYAVAVGRDRPGEILDDADRLRSLLERHRVHTYISGHHHAYFPGHRGSLQMLHAGAMGGGPRPLLNSNLAPFKTLTVVDVRLAEADTVYTTYDLRTWQVVDQQTLPRLVVGPNGWILRRDVEEANLSAAERAAAGLTP